MRTISYASLACLLFFAAVDATAQAATCSGAACGGTLVLIGTHTSGPGQGIFSARLDRRTGALTPLGLAGEIDRPTWLERDPKRDIVYSVSETGNDGKSQGGVYSLSVDRRTGRLTTISRVDSGGGGATYLDYDTRLATLFVANYGSGSVAAVPVAADGTLSPVASLQQNSGSGPHRRQAGPHAHAAVVDPTGRYVLVPDLGADKVFVYRWNPTTRALTPGDQSAVQFPAGSGPRHLVFSRDGRFAFVDTELSGEVHTLRWDARAGTLTPASHVALDAADFTGTRSAAEIALSADGRFLYVSNRGANLIQLFAIAPTGALREVQRIDSGGKSPWSFGLDPSGRWLVVADEASSKLTEFAVDRSTGRMSPTSNQLDVPQPVALSFLK